ncbi:hypothetical protein PYCCODRAFT_960145 [Trametes coccinea BRFM310]|uniref:Uncharacterized protein n=1 Tax=Trametes coccinea (strain BRFM310) TaxID=1353009 RepID=A0A1Y2J2H6_TRAC3|nr:hypothetical protein PYCCODRAFT_960145 [Trametes coccinea BRFM310]
MRRRVSRRVCALYVIALAPLRCSVYRSLHVLYSLRRPLFSFSVVLVPVSYVCMCLCTIQPTVSTLECSSYPQTTHCMASSAPRWPGRVLAHGGIILLVGSPGVPPSSRFRKPGLRAPTCVMRWARSSARTHGDDPGSRLQLESVSRSRSTSTVSLGYLWTLSALAAGLVSLGLTSCLGLAVSQRR